jgi:hypothetical protein
MPRPAGPERPKNIFLRVTDREHRLASALAATLGKSVQAALLELLHEGAKALKISVPDEVPANQLALAFAGKRRPLRGPSGGMRAIGMGAGRGKVGGKRAGKPKGRRAGKRKAA